MEFTEYFEEGLIPDYVWKFVKSVSKSPITTGILAFMIWSYIKNKTDKKESYSNSDLNIIYNEMKEGFSAFTILNNLNKIKSIKFVDTYSDKYDAGVSKQQMKNIRITVYSFDGNKIWFVSDNNKVAVYTKKPADNYKHFNKNADSNTFTLFMKVINLDKSENVNIIYNEMKTILEKLGNLKTFSEELNTNDIQTILNIKSNEDLLKSLNKDIDDRKKELHFYKNLKIDKFDTENINGKTWVFIPQYKTDLVTGYLKNKIKRELESIISRLETVYIQPYNKLIADIKIGNEQKQIILKHFMSMPKMTEGKVLKLLLKKYRFSWKTGYLYEIINEAVKTNKQMNLQFKLLDKYFKLAFDTEINKWV
jgi:hypothetical protein